MRKGIKQEFCKIQKLFRLREFLFSTLSVPCLCICSFRNMFTTVHLHACSWIKQVNLCSPPINCKVLLHPSNARCAYPTLTNVIQKANLMTETQDVCFLPQVEHLPFSFPLSFCWRSTFMVSETNSHVPPRTKQFVGVREACKHFSWCITIPSLILTMAPFPLALGLAGTA